MPIANTVVEVVDANTCKAADQVAEVIYSTQLQVANCFPSAVYLIDRPDFLAPVQSVSEEALEVARGKHALDEIYPLYMSDSYFTDPRVSSFSEFVGSTAWNIMSEQGYAMHDKRMTFTEMWTQEHYKHSAMEQHVHGYGAQIVGFYFLETPAGCSNIVFHDPRAAKVQIDLREQDVTNVTLASKMINFAPKPGMLIFSNAWLAHSFTRHANEQPLKFVHFNLNVTDTPLTCPAPAIVI